VTSDFRCSIDSEARGEDLAGSASSADRFVLVEFPTPWPKKAIEVFEGEFQPALVTAAAAANAKILLIRRHGHRTGDVRRWAVVDARARRVLWGTWEAQADLAPLIDAVGADSAAWSDDPIVLVCTHALHDTCCGVRGRPVAAALTESHGDLVWESSHVGGHRYAGNVVLPLDGTYYGRLGSHDASGVVESHLAGVVSPEHLRGFSWMPPAAQVVAVDVLRRWGPAPASAFTSADAVQLGDDRWQVELGGTSPLPDRVTAEVESRVGADARLSCRADPTPTESFAILRRGAH
jgi:(2Fe-2S) ferredoxin